jgi:hypothetical protein
MQASVRGNGAPPHPRPRADGSSGFFQVKPSRSPDALFQHRHAPIKLGFCRISTDRSVTRQPKDLAPRRCSHACSVPNAQIQAEGQPGRKEQRPSVLPMLCSSSALAMPAPVAMPVNCGTSMVGMRSAPRAPGSSTTSHQGAAGSLLAGGAGAEGTLCRDPRACGRLPHCRPPGRGNLDRRHLARQRGAARAGMVQGRFPVEVCTVGCRTHFRPRSCSASYSALSLSRRRLPCLQPPGRVAGGSVGTGGRRHLADRTQERG